MTYEESLKPPRHEKLAHLSEEEITEVIELYNAGERVYEILSTYRIDVQDGRLFQILPPKVITEKTCPYCNLPTWQTRTRTGLKAEYCPDCGHDNIGFCNCKNCTSKRQAKKERDRIMRKRVLANQVSAPVRYQDLTLTQKAYLAAFLHAGLSEQLEFIHPLNDLPYKLTPFDNVNLPILTSTKIFAELLSNRIIKISEHSPATAFPPYEDDGSTCYYTCRVYTEINVEPQIFELLMYPKRFNQAEVDEVLNLWIELAVAEIYEYLSFQIESVNHRFDYSEKTKVIILEMLKHLSTGQIFSIIWSSVNYSSRCFMEGRLKRNQFINHVINACKRHAERAFTEDWTVKNFDRCKQLSQTMISSIFYNKVLGIGDKGFTSVPNSSGLSSLII